ncbi:hypothetical protein LEP1GSC047_3575 [Leptospira inadai serovar Lyme str. 10]|uniref:Uncharacterized protein n=2 Tax=Leptospira inadai serovar Lyme TaxID=293084 RepID=V6HD82_9LEPT|nr:hypothetical protein [Leptospira inadai]EQA38021.1 hypothetical protein LEP1GSC047_3575 [Leptospira inadai serovar Lyme str. 10]PNV74774.1 hypothetical protein BES34_012455 [Leptospira inadai serovar Lyme]
MNPKILLRIAAFLILFHAVGHTFGMQARKNVQDPPAKALVQEMSEVKVPMMGELTNRSYDDFYYGMGIALSLALFSITILLWILGGVAVSNPQTTKNLLYPIFFNLSGLAVIEFVYFFPLPAWTSTLSAVCIAISLIRLGKK